MFVNMDEICLFQQAKMSIQQFIITIKRVVYGNARCEEMDLSPVTIP